MNSHASSDDASIHYYDADYPSEEHSAFPENFDDTTVNQGISHDVARYKEVAGEVGGPILELCCGTGRVAIPLAKLGFQVTGVDVSPAILERFREHLTRQDKSVSAKILLIEQDITRLSLAKRDFPLAIIPFNSLLLVTSIDDQLRALKHIAKHLCNGGRLVLDLVNPLRLKLDGDPVPRPFFTRKNPNTGNTYTRFAMVGAFDENQRQRLYGWYDEIASDGTIRRSFYSIYWRPIFRFEIELMLKCAGFRIEALEGGHLREPFSAQSPRMFIQARKEVGDDR